MSRPAAKLQWPDLTNIIRKLVSQSGIADIKSNRVYWAVWDMTGHTELFTTQWYVKSQKISKTAISFNPEPK